MATPLSESQTLRLATFTALYFAQGVPWGFIGVGYVVMLADLGLDNAAIGAAIGLAYLPWSFKILWGPLLDAVPALTIGRRRPFIIFAELLMGITILGLLPLDPVTQLSSISMVLFLHNTFASLQDVAVDALAVDLLQEDERGRANSFMWAGKSLGVALGGGGGIVLAKHLGWNALFIVMAILVWLIMLLPLLLPERSPDPDDQVPDSRLLGLGWFLIPFAAVGGIMFGLSRIDHPLIPVIQPFAAVFGAIAAWPLVDRKGFAEMRWSMSFPTPWWGVAAAVLMPAGYALVSSPMTRLLRVDLALSEEKIGFLSGVVDPISGVLGALIGGVIADRIGGRKAVGSFMGGIVACMAIFGLSQGWWPSYTFLIGWTIVFVAMINGFNTGTLGLYQGLSNPRIGATQFAVFMAGTNLTYAWAAPLGGLIADKYGYPLLFGVAAVIQLLAILLVIPLDTRRASAYYRGETL